ncbi:MAG: ChbG/HpnK family deacetylase [Gammaproteobacteria bacterium]|nr:ChbG/HpnK family deacetylase [Gammaproteobacteria bacterium]
MKVITVCADDYALNKYTSLGIRKLIEAGRVSATSCMTNSPYWPEEAQALKLLVNSSFETGLHFNLTHNFGHNKFTSLNKLISKSLLGIIDKKWLERELQTQLDLFELAIGRPPDYIDGHHHVHVFPVIRSILIKVLKARYCSDKKNWQFWIRRVNPPLRDHDSKIKALILKILAYNFDKLVINNGYKLSGNLVGVYSLSENSEYSKYSKLVKLWLSKIEDNSLLMCHPSVFNPEPDFSSASLMEYNFLINSEFLKFCQDHNIIIKKIFKN